MATDYIPSSYRDFRDWLQLQKERLPAAAPALNMTADEQAAHLAAVDALLPKVSSLVDTMDAVDILAADVSALSDTHLPMLRQSIRRAKTSAGCTPGLAQQLGWARNGGEMDPAGSQPVITATVQAGRVRFDGRKPGFEAVNLYRRRKGETDWTLVAIRKRKFPLYDEAPLAAAGVPEVREYRAFGVVADEEIGQPSASVEVIFAG